MKKFIVRGIVLFTGLMLLGGSLCSQNRPGTWKDYFSYASALKVVISDKIFCATEGGLFFVDRDDHSINTLSANNGLSDTGIRTLAWNDEKKILLIAYQNSNIDLVTEKRVINLSDLKRKSITGDKTIYNIHFHEEEAYLACGFGIVNVNIGKGEIKETYVIGENGTDIKVFDVETDGKYVYAATEKGILRAEYGQANLLDYRSWSRMGDVPHSNEKFSFLDHFNGNLVAVYTRDQYDGDEAYLRIDGQWRKIIPEVTFFNDLDISSEYLTATCRGDVFVYDRSLNLFSRIREYQLGNETVSPIQCMSAVTASDGAVWIADHTHGLIQCSGGKYEQNLPPGPENNTVFSMTVFQNDLWIARGGRTDPWNNQFLPPMFQRMRNNEWTVFSNRKFPAMEGFYDIVQVAADPSDAEHIYAASWGGGVLEFQNDQLVKRYNNQNSPLQTAIPENPGAPYTRIGGLAFDSENTLWITNSQSSQGLHSLNRKGEWKSFELPEISGSQFTLGQVIVNANDDKWIVVPRGKDIYVVNKDGSKKKYLQVTSYFNNGEQEIYNRMNDVYSIAEDLTGEIWIGTSKGIAVFAIPQKVWQDQDYYAYQPSLDLKDGLYHPLLETETVTAIVVDGANRKWLGTKNSGIYLVSARGESEIQHFTSANSPLLSNTITSMAMIGSTGELFIGTDKGLISYQGDAPLGNKDYSQVYVYPNPVRENFTGDVTIAGLKGETDVHITDIAGNLVFKGKSLGGKIMWNGKNLNGKRVSTGVYMVFCSDITGDETHVAKLLFVR